VLLVAGLGGVAAFAAVADRTPAARWRAAPPAPTASAPGASPSATATDAAQTVALAATGDVIMGDAPSRLPADGGRGFFASVKQALAADLVMGNLEEPLTEDTGYVKCKPETPSPGPSASASASAGPGRAASASPSGSSDCHQFRAPPEYAKHLADAGFDLLNLANNHAYDYGPDGNRNTRTALERNGLAHTGAPKEITVKQIGAIKVAVLGFSSYAWSNSLIDIEAAKRVVRQATQRADIVVVQVHMGGEGADKIHVKPGTEMFLGENRGDPVKFSHAVIEAGADLVVGHSPHVLRALEFYQGRLIAYSLGNFAGGGGTLNNSGRLGLGAVLKVSLRADGSWAAGQLVSTYMGSGGRPAMDGGARGLALVRQLCESDFPTTAPKWGPAGQITPPTA
jgi:poly-gamma-glutamate capsule biosynthesis protein CapA/YwtB (metallophosphatase superfamily)